MALPSTAYDLDLFYDGNAVYMFMSAKRISFPAFSSCTNRSSQKLEVAVQKFSGQYKHMRCYSKVIFLKRRQPIGYQ